MGFTDKAWSDRSSSAQARKEQEGKNLGDRHKLVACLRPKQPNVEEAELTASSVP